jgi:hypothetical protein
MVKVDIKIKYDRYLRMKGVHHNDNNFMKFGDPHN